jgi:hypothetical protein
LVDFFGNVVSDWTVILCFDWSVVYEMELSDWFLFLYSDWWMSDRLKYSSDHTEEEFENTKVVIKIKGQQHTHTTKDSTLKYRV